MVHGPGKREAAVWLRSYTGRIADPGKIDGYRLQPGMQPKAIPEGRTTAGLPAKAGTRFRRRMPVEKEIGSMQAAGNFPFGGRSCLPLREGFGGARASMLVQVRIIGAVLQLPPVIDIEKVLAVDESHPQCMNGIQFATVGRRQP